MRAIHAVLFIVFAAACNADRDVVQTPSSACYPEVTGVAEDDDSLGFTADEAMVALLELLPNHIAWTSMSAGQTEADLSWEIGDREGPPEIVTEAFVSGQDEMCQSAPVMRLTINLGLSLDDGAVSGSGLVAVDFLALTPDAVFPFAPSDAEDHIVVSLASPYAEEMEAYSASGQFAAYEVDEIWFSAIGDPADGEASISAYYRYEDGAVSSLYRGPWSTVAE